MTPSDLNRLQRLPREKARWEKAQQKLLSGRHTAALNDYRDLVKRLPKIAELWFELGNAASGTLDFALANQAYRRTLELAPDNPSLLTMVGRQFQQLRQLDDARECYARAVAASPDSVDARINLAVWLEKERRTDEAWEQVMACLAKHPDDDQALYFKAFLQHRGKQPAQAEETLRNLIRRGPRYPYVTYSSRHLLGVVLDEQGRCDEAMKWLLEAKAIVRTIADTRMLEQGYDTNQRHRMELLDRMDKDTLRRWRTEAGDMPDAGRFAFLGGHPRSGTTLMEQVLDAHPELMAFDEAPSFAQEIITPLSVPGTDGRTSFSSLDAVSAPRRMELRERYRKSLLRECPNVEQAKILLDKNPSPTASLLVWLRVFPELKVIIALRDPRDVLISCFFLNIMLNSTNVNFLSIERTAKHYADLMGVWWKIREMGGFDWIESRYEDVVADLETEGRKTTSFLGLEWHENQSRYDENASRKVMYAPTYHDVTRKIYSSAVGRWKRYADALEPALPILEPFCKEFGY